jgi:FkbM family methyltransferase
MKGLTNVTGLAKFVRSSQLLWNGSAPFKLARWLTLCRLCVHKSRNILGFDVECFTRESLRYLYEEIFAREEYVFESNVQEPLIFDCGANIGIATLFFKWLYPKSTVVAFEADPATFRLLKRNIEKNQLKDVSAHNVALWDENGRIPFFVNAGEPGSLLMSTRANRIPAQEKEITVDARRLSEFIDAPVELLKLDVEGSEARVIADLLESGKLDFVRQMIVEYHHNIPNETPRLGSFLSNLESAGLEYQFNGWLFSPLARNVFQDVLIYAYRRDGRFHPSSRQANISLSCTR